MTFRRRFEGQPLKRVALSFGGAGVRGEALVTARGIEGGAVYALSARLREAIANAGTAEMHIDLRPDVSLADLAARLAKPRGKQSLSTFLRKAANLSPVEIGLLHEAAHARLSEPEPHGARRARRRIGAATAHRRCAHRDGHLDGRRRRVGCRRRASRCCGALPGVFVAGEMLDWEAPTGGYLLQACLATGALAGPRRPAWLAQKHASP